MAHYFAPHSQEWFAALETFNPIQAAHTRTIIERAKNSNVCSVCGDQPAADYKLVHPIPANEAIATIRLCDDCRLLRETSGESFMPFQSASV